MIKRDLRKKMRARTKAGNLVLGGMSRGLKISDCSITSASIGSLDFDKLSGQSKAHWNELGVRLFRCRAFDDRCPLLSRLSFLPLIGFLYKRARLGHVLSGHSC